MGKDNEKEKQLSFPFLFRTGFLHKSREAMFNLLTDPDYFIWSEKLAKENLDYQIEADGLSERDIKGDQILFGWNQSNGEKTQITLRELLAKLNWDRGFCAQCNEDYFLDLSEASRDERIKKAATSD